ncbi:MAG TPA: TIR domain-containing protein [Rhodanobacter sp.]
MSESSGFRYRAFISYSHGDKAWADWLHKALETYAVPKRLVGQTNAAGVIPRRLTPIFRDRDELASAHDLGGKVNAALAESANLIVICSPRSAASHWVQEEILAYKRLGRRERIFCLIVDGQPHASDLPGHEADECFAPPLRFQLDADGQLSSEHAEPIAADARADKDGKNNAKLKLIAGMLDVGFDALKQREMQRRNRRMAAITALALVVMTVTTVLAVVALISRHDAVIAQHKAVVAQQAAERRQKQAEGLVGFMLGDLNDKLGEVQRLDIMQAVDDKAMAFFESLPSIDVTPEALVQRAKALEKIGSVRMSLGDLNGTLEAFRASAAISSQLAAAAPDDAARQVAYSRIITFIGMVHWNQGDLEAAQEDFESARRVLQPFLVHARDEPSVLLQLGFLSNDIGHVLEARGKPDGAENEYRNMLDLTRQLVALDPENDQYAEELGSAHNNLGKMALLRGDLAAAVAEYRADDAIETRLSTNDPRNNQQRQNMLRVRAILGRTLALAGDTASGIRDLQQAVDLAGQLHRISPRDTTIQDHLAMYSTQLARLQRFSGHRSTAASSNAKAIEILAALTRKDPGNQGWQSDYAQALTEQAAGALAANQTTTARALGQQAIDILDPMLAKQPDNRGTLLATVTARLLLADASTDQQAAQRLRQNALNDLQRPNTDRRDPRVAALQVEALVALGRKAEAVPLLGPLWSSGYRDPALVAFLARVGIDYPVNADFAQRLAKSVHADVGRHGDRPRAVRADGKHP